jgi:hypothetical protein
MRIRCVYGQSWSRAHLRPTDLEGLCSRLSGEAAMAGTRSQTGSSRRVVVKDGCDAAMVSCRLSKLAQKVTHVCTSSRVARHAKFPRAGPRALVTVHLHIKRTHSSVTSQLRPWAFSRLTSCLALAARILQKSSLPCLLFDGLCSKEPIPRVRLLYALLACNYGQDENPKGVNRTALETTMVSHLDNLTTFISSCLPSWTVPVQIKGTSKTHKGNTSNNNHHRRTNACLRRCTSEGQLASRRSLSSRRSRSSRL